MFKTLMFFIQLLRTSIKASISTRGAFLIESTLMIVNNLIFFSIWWIFFSRYPDVANWHFNDMVILISVGSGSYGLMQICFGGIRNLSKMIQDGALDPFMTQPKNLLLHVAGSKSFAKGWGQLMTSFIMIILSKISSPVDICLILLGIVSGCLVFTSINIIAHSLPFWMGTFDGVSKKICEALFLFALYPTNIYSGWLQVIMFTLIPAGIISYLPVELIRHFSWSQLLILITSASAFLVLAIGIFYFGLKKYESGNRFRCRI